MLLSKAPLLECATQGWLAKNYAGNKKYFFIYKKV